MLTLVPSRVGGTSAPYIFKLLVPREPFRKLTRKRRAPACRRPRGVLWHTPVAPPAASSRSMWHPNVTILHSGQLREGGNAGGGRGEIMEDYMGTMVDDGESQAIIWRNRERRLVVFLETYPLGSFGASFSMYIFVAWCRRL